jgi:phosphatidylserine decarboxylase
MYQATELFIPITVLQPDDIPMTMRSLLARLLAHDGLNFLLTNRFPRRRLTLLMARFSKIEQPLIRDASIAVWRALSDLDLSEARKQRFDSLHDCFIRELRVGARIVDTAPGVLVSPCDAIVGAHGVVTRGMALQAKGQSYPLTELLGGAREAEVFDLGCFVTLRLTASMYHRFHAPAECRVTRVRYFPGDTWNVNPAALHRVPRLFCKNERAVIDCRLEPSSEVITLVPVAAILVASLRLHCLDALLHLRYSGPSVVECDFPLKRGQEMGWFEHGSTIIVLAPPGYRFCEGVREGRGIKMGQALLRCADQASRADKVL